MNERQSPPPVSQPGSSVACREGFLLTRQWRDTPAGIELTYWLATKAGPLRVRIEEQEAVCFVPRPARVDESLARERRPVSLRSLAGEDVDGLYFRTQRQLADARHQLRTAGIPLFESEIKPSDRYLMERFVTAGMVVEGQFSSGDRFAEVLNPKLTPLEVRPSLRILSLDIETEGIDGALYSVAATRGAEYRMFLLRAPWSQTSERALAVWSEAERVELSLHSTEADLLTAFFGWLRDDDPDGIIGWNVVDFDLQFLMRRAKQFQIRFDIGRGGEGATILPPSGPGQKRIARVPGRLVLDGIDTLKNATWSFENFSLESVAQQLLGRGKRISETDVETGLMDRSSSERVQEITRLYHEAPSDLLAYNLEDCRLVEGIFDKTNLLEFAVVRAQLTGLAADRIGGSVAAFDNLYLPRMHRRGFVAPDTGSRGDDVEMSPGGYVMDSKPGLYDNVVVLDFKSLYPSIIRTFNVDPVALAQPGHDPIDGFRGATFARGEQILPSLIQHLWEARESAKGQGDLPLSRAIKILMNSLYGVLGTPACRFFDARLASSITMRGHEILSHTQKAIEDQGYQVLYGDTDSLFVLFGQSRNEDECSRLAAALVKRLNQEWAERLRERHQLDCFLELEFETHYRRFFMPTVRGSEQGSKKRYAGLVVRDGREVLEFKGLESVRSDWTPLAREFQREIYGRIFRDEPFEDYVKATADALMGGRRDAALVYRKRLGRALKDYKRNVPPHAQAARKSKEPGRFIRYVMTTNGPEPLDNNPSPLDYYHYLDRQLAPAADAILQLKGTSVERILDRQMSLF